MSREREIDPQSSEKIEAHIGEHVEDFIQKLMTLSEERNKMITGVFNDVDIVVKAGTDPFNARMANELLKKYKEDQSRKTEEYSQSPAGIAAREKDKREQQELQEETDTLVASLAELDFSNVGAVLDWLCSFQWSSDNVNIRKDIKKVIAVLESKGFKANVYVNEGKAVFEDKDKAARYIIGQALDGLESGGYINQVIHSFVEKWKEKFGK